jgi:Zn finger protein HypA/HybF involved in hydrogenase expression
MSETGRQVGYMNAYHQRIIARAMIRGEPAIRFVMWCSRCGHHYVTDEGDVVRRRCPNHDSGRPAITSDSRRVKWVT